MQSTLPSDDSEAKRLEEEESAKRRQDEEMLAQGSTAAAKAFAQRNSIGVGDPIFAGNYRMKLQEEEAKNRLKQEQFIRDQRNSIGMGSHISSSTSRPSGTKPGMVMPSSSSVSIPSNGSGFRGTSPPSTSQGASSVEAFPSPNAPNGVLAEAAQRVLEAARRSAKGDVSQPSNREASASVTSHNTSISNHKTSTEASNSLRPSIASPSPPIEGSESRSHSLSPSPAPSIKGKRKSFLGTFRKSSTNFEEDLQNSNVGKKGKGKNSDGESVKSGGGKKGSRSRTPSESASKSPAASLSTTRENEDDGGTMTPGGTLGRRKYRDTRELHLLASELAAQALVGNEYPYASFAAASGQGQPQANGSQSPNYQSGTRTPSEGLTVGSSSNRRGAAAYSWGGPEAAPHAVGMNMPNGSASQTNLISSPSHSGFLTPMTSNPNVAGSAPTSPRFASAELSPGGSPKLGVSPSGQRSRQGSFGYAIHATQTQQAKLNGLPQDMLTGLGDGPYPTLARRLEAAGLDMLDPFGIPTTHDRDSPFAASVRATNNGSSSPGTSISSHHQQQSSGGTTTPGGGRRPMMTMSMSAPAAELDYGLTKVGKGKQSRNASRNVTPQQSREKLRDRAKKDAEKDGTGLVGNNNGSSKKGGTPNVISSPNPSLNHLGNNQHPPSAAGAAVNVNSGNGNSLGLSKSISPSGQSTNSIRPPSSPVPSSSSSSSRQHQQLQQQQQQPAGQLLGSPAPIQIPRSPRSISPNPTPSMTNRSINSSSNPSSSSSNLNTTLSKTGSNNGSNEQKSTTNEVAKKSETNLKPGSSHSDSNGMLSTSASSKGLSRFSFFGKKKDQEKEKEVPIPSSPVGASSGAKVGATPKPVPSQPQAQPPAPRSAQPPTSPTNGSAPRNIPAAQPTSPANASRPKVAAAPISGMSTGPSDSSVASHSTRESDDSFRLPYLANSPEKTKPSTLAAAAPMSSLGSQRQMASPTTGSFPSNPQAIPLNPNQREISRSRSREAMPAPQSTAPLQGTNNSSLGLPNGANNVDSRGRRISNVSANAVSSGLPNGASPASPPRPERSNDRMRAESRSPGRRPNGMVGGPNGTPQQQQQERSRVPSNTGASFQGLPLGNNSSTSLASTNKGGQTPRIPASPSSNSISSPKNGAAPVNSNSSSKLNPKNQEKEKSSGGRFSKFVKSLTSSSDKDGRNERSGTPSSITSSKSNKSSQIKSQPQSPQQSQANKAQTMRGLGNGRQNSLPPGSNSNGTQSLNSRPTNFQRSTSGPGPNSQNPAPAPSPSRNLINRANPFQLASNKPQINQQPASSPSNGEKTGSPSDSGKSTPSFATAGSLQNSPEIARQNLLSKEELERQARLTDALGPLIASNSVSQPS